MSGIGHLATARKVKPTPSRDSRAPEFSDEALALCFADRHIENLRYTAFRSHWYVWRGWQWVADDTLAAFDLARAICRESAKATGKAKLAHILSSARTAAAVERLAKADRRLAATVDQWDDNAKTLCTPE
jgi:putative DNA primase/helicase